MRALRDCPASALQQIRGVLTDIDDTLTTDGRLPAERIADHLVDLVLRMLEGPR